MKQMEKTIRELVNQLNQASDAYYNGGREIMSNKEYDSRYEQLSKLEQETGYVFPDSPTQNVGAVVNGLRTVRHEYPALSLDKTKDVKKFSVFDVRDRQAVVMWKLDGSTCVATYDGGKLQVLATRGNGETGSDITHNAPYIRGLPMTIPYHGKVVVRGEAVMSYADFKRVNARFPEEEQYRNPRNLANATVKLYDSNLLKNRPVAFVAFRLVAMEGLPGSFHKQLSVLNTLGFNVVEHTTCPASVLADTLETYTRMAESYPYPVDGLVVAANDAVYADEQPGTGKFPNKLSGYALKWADETEETVLRDIEWSASRTGLLNPIAVFDPVELEGTTVSRATLHNVSYVLEKDLKAGDRITVYKANKIIPAVDENLDADGAFSKGGVSLMQAYARYLLPMKCPVCGANTSLFESNGTLFLKCLNEDCAAKKIGALVHYAERDCVNIAGLSESKVTALVNRGFLKGFVDLYRLGQYRDEIIAMDGLGEKSYAQLQKAVQASRAPSFVPFIHALGIPNIGKGQAKLLRNWLGEMYPDTAYMDSFLDAVAHGVDFTVIDGFGSVMDKSLKEWLCQNMQMLTELLMELEVTEKPSGNVLSAISGKTFVVTGKVTHFANRDEIRAKIETFGGRTAGSVSKNTDFLINNDVESTSGKNRKAKELGIPIISEEEFLSMY